MRKNELQLSQHNCVQAKSSKLGNNKSLAQSNEGVVDDSIGTAHSNSGKPHNERRTHKKNHNGF